MKQLPSTTLWLRSTFGVVAIAVFSICPSWALGQMEFERDPIAYFDRPPADPIAHLQARIDSGDVTLDFDSQRGYLPAVLRALDVLPSSQMLVFSKTSFQLTRITPQRPRAVYFNDATYVGWVQDGDVVEISTVDPCAGSDVLHVVAGVGRDSALCPRQGSMPQLPCVFTHARGARSFGAVGVYIAQWPTSLWFGNIYHGPPQPLRRALGRGGMSPASTARCDTWVTFCHGTGKTPSNWIAKRARNITDLSALLDVHPYLRPTSDIVALMVLEHQTQMHNAITVANYTARRAAYQDRIVNEALERAVDFQSDSTKRRIASAGDNLLEHLLYCDELQLASPVQGVSGFTEQFSSQGPHDSQGRSLRDFELQQRLFRYPCSYLIYSEAFDALPAPMKRYVTGRLYRVLTGADLDAKFAHLSPDDRRAIREILQYTKPDLFQDVLAVTNSQGELINPLLSHEP